MYWERWNNKSYSREWNRSRGESRNEGESESEVEVEIEVSHEQEMKSSEMKSSEVKGSEVKGSEMNVLSHPLSFKRMQICLQRFICSKKGAEIAILKLFKQCKITVKRLLEIICKLLNCLLNLMCNWVMCNGNSRFSEKGCTCKLEGCTCKSERCTGSDSLNLLQLIMNVRLFYLTSYFHCFTSFFTSFFIANSVLLPSAICLLYFLTAI